MKRGGFKRPIYERKPTVVMPIPEELRGRSVYARSPEATKADPKGETLQHQGYMAAVRKLPCYRCGIVGFSQFCHSDEGKGERYKSDCRLGWPGCGPHLSGSGMVNGCHYDIGTARVLPKQERRAFEAEAARKTRETIRLSGAWPKSLPDWPTDRVEELNNQSRADEAHNMRQTA